VDVKPTVFVRVKRTGNGKDKSKKQVLRLRRRMTIFGGGLKLLGWRKEFG
jgi:hypothetical protein